MAQTTTSLFKTVTAAAIRYNDANKNISVLKRDDLFIIHFLSQITSIIILNYIQVGLYDTGEGCIITQIPIRGSRFIGCTFEQFWYY